MLSLSAQRIAKFWSLVDKSGDCWLWRGCANRHTGYGVFVVATKGRGTINRAAHAISYELCIGPVPKGHDVHHTCRIKLCQNPAHFEAKLKSDHSRLHNYLVRRQSQCKRGHDLTGDNVYLYWHRGREHRMCKACAAAAGKVRYRLAHPSKERSIEDMPNYGQGRLANVTRNEGIVKRWLTGEKASEIALSLGLSKQRIKQILARAGCRNERATAA